MPGPNSLVVFSFFLFIFIHVPTTQAQVSHSTPRHQLKRRRSSKLNSSNDGSSSDKSFVNSKRYIPTYNWEQKEYVKAHNELREESGVPPLQWHPDLANSSHNWASELQDTCDYRHHSHGVYGENIFWSLYKEFTPTDVVRRWYSEKMHFDHTTNLCKCQPETDKCECGHYLNVVWKTTQWVGCSNAVYCKEAKGLIVVCQYDPLGNYKGVDPLNPQLPDDDDDDDDEDDDEDDEDEKEEDHGVPPPPPPPPPPNHGASGHPPPPPPPAINTNHEASGDNHKASIHPPPPRLPPPPAININQGASGYNHKASIHPLLPPLTLPPAINTNHGAFGNNRRASIHPPPPPPPPNNNNNRASGKSPNSMNNPEVSRHPAPPVINGSEESNVTRHTHHTPRQKGDTAALDE